MKSIITLCIFFSFSLISMNINAQEKSTSPVLPENISDYSTTRPMEVSTYRTKYIVDTKKLITYFESGQIPASFPLYNYDISKEDNIKLIHNWINEAKNKDLLSEDGIAKVAEIKDKIKNQK